MRCNEWCSVRCVACRSGGPSAEARTLDTQVRQGAHARKRRRLRDALAAEPTASNAAGAEALQAGAGRAGRASPGLTWNDTMMPRLGELVTRRDRVCRPERSAASLCLLSRRYRSSGPMAPEQLQARGKGRGAPGIGAQQARQAELSGQAVHACGGGWPVAGCELAAQEWSWSRICRRTHLQARTPTHLDSTAAASCADDVCTAAASTRLASAM